MSELNEHIVLVGDDRDSERILRQGGWQVERTSADQVRDLYGAISAPLLFFIDPRGSIHYKGGYARRSDARDGFHEAEIWDALRAGRIVSPLPAYGCALTFGCYVGALRQAAARLE